MKIAAVYGSPDKKGNSASITDAILRGAINNGHSIDRIYLHDIKMGNCLGCKNAGKIHQERYCIHNDEMTTEIIPKLIQTDLIIISSPVYMGHITGITKTFLDRWYTFCEEDFNIRFLPGKKFITVVTSGASGEVFKNVTEYLDYWLSNFFKLEKVDQIHAGDLMGSGAIAEKKELLNRAYALGKLIN